MLMGKLVCPVIEHSIFSIWKYCVFYFNNKTVFSLKVFAYIINSQSLSDNFGSIVKGAFKWEDIEEKGEKHIITIK